MDKLVFDHDYWFPVNQELWDKYKLTKVITELGLSLIEDCLPANIHYAKLSKGTSTIRLVKNQPKCIYLELKDNNVMTMIQSCLKSNKGGDRVDHPDHYNSHPSGIECIEIAKHYSFCIGNVIKYIWRAGLKKDAALRAEEKELEDLLKAKWYLENAIDELRKKLKKDE